jgi:hypothetical protein
MSHLCYILYFMARRLFKVTNTDAMDPLTYTVTAFEFFVLQTTWRWPPIGAETCSVRSAQ